MKTSALVLLYNFTPARRSQIMPLCIRNGVRVRAVTKEEYGEPIGALCRINGCETSNTVYEGDGFSDEMMVLNGFTRQALNTFLNDFRKHKVKTVGLKAVVTEHNMRWDSVHLHDEISKEHAAMHRK